MTRCWLLLFAVAAWAAPVKPGPTQLRIPVCVENKQGSEDPPIEAKDFSVTLDGSPSRLVDVQRPGDALVILLVMDLAGDLTVAEPAKEATIAEIKKLPEAVFVGLLRAQDGLKVIMDPTTDHDALSGAIESLPVSGKSGLLPTIEVACRIADSMLRKSTTRVGVLYVTDSSAQNYREDFMNPVINSSDSHDLSRQFPETLMREKISKLETSLTAWQSPVFIAHLNYQGDRVSEEYQNGLKRLADATGGVAAFSRSTTEIPGAIEHGFAALVSHYSLTLALPERVSTSPQIKVSVPDADRTFTYRTRYRLRSK
jgi:hypothetical protein